MSDIFASINEFLDTCGSQPARTFHCGVAVMDALRSLTRPDDTPSPPRVELMGVPVHADQTMPAGRWEFREDGQTVKFGDITPDVPGVFYVPGVGFVAAPVGGVPRV